MPPYQGGGEMNPSVQYQRTREQPLRFEAGTPDIAGAIGLHAAMDYLDGIAVTASPHDMELGADALHGCPCSKASGLWYCMWPGGIVSFLSETSTLTTLWSWQT